MKRLELNFEGKRVLVTGSTMGIGFAIAQAFHAAGATVAINGRSQKSVEQAIGKLGGGERLVAAPGDFGSTSERNAALGKLLGELGGLDVLVNNAGRGDECMLDALTEAEWDKMISLNLKGAFFAIQTCVPALRESKGCVINVASALGLIAGPPGVVLYSITKSAMVQMTRALALHLVADGIRVNTLAPGWIDTPMIQGDNERSNNALYDYINYSTPLGRIGTPQECAGAVLYLAASFAGFTTGATFSVDGGISAVQYI